MRTDGRDPHAAPADPRTEALRRLGLAPDADAEAIRQAWKALVRRYHPDQMQGDKVAAGRRLAELNAAFDLLRGPAPSASPSPAPARSPSSSSSPSPSAAPSGAPDAAAETAARRAASEARARAARTAQARRTAQAARDAEAARARAPATEAAKAARRAAQAAPGQAAAGNSTPGHSGPHRPAGPPPDTAATRRARARFRAALAWLHPVPRPSCLRFA